MSVVDKIKAPIKEELKVFEKYFSGTMKSDIRLLNIVTAYLLKQKGKQMRPMFVYLTANLFGKSTDATRNGAALIELMHTATLVHDDVVDDSNQRRGFFSINALWKNKVAVLLGDYLLSKGLLLAVNNENYDLLKIVSKAVEQMSEGELLQIEKARKQNITEDVYFEIIQKKTAVLIAACAAVGAKSAGANVQEVEQMWQMGEDIGMAFQIKDDLFDLEMDNKTGKPAGNDIQERKMTLPVIQALKLTDANTAKRIRKIIGKKNKSNEEVKQVVDFVNNSDGVKYAIDKMNWYKDNAIEAVGRFPDSAYKNSIIELINYTTSRKK